MPSSHIIPPIVWPGKGKRSVWTDLSYGRRLSSYPVFGGVFLPAASSGNLAAGRCTRLSGTSKGQQPNHGNSQAGL